MAEPTGYLLFVKRLKESQSPLKSNFYKRIIVSLISIIILISVWYFD